MSWCLLFAKGLLWELHYSKLCVSYNSWKSLAFSPWFPPSFTFQLIYLIYRWIICLFFSVSVFFTGFDEFSGDEKYFIYLTNWIFLLWTVYTIWATFSVTFSFIMVFGIQRSKYQDQGCEKGPCNHEYVIDDRPAGCCGWSNDKTFWHQKVLWILFSLAVPLQLLLVMSFWSLIYSPNSPIPPGGFVNIVTHLVNGICAIVDIFVSGIPYRLLHVVYSLLFGGTWLVFSGIYFAAGGTNASGRHYIYSTLDYMNAPVTATVSGLLLLFIGVPLFHIIAYCCYLLRELLLFVISKYCCPCRKRIQENSRVSAENDEEARELK